MMGDSDFDSFDPRAGALTATDRRILSSMATADSARVGVVILRVVSVVVAVATVAGNTLTVLELGNGDSFLSRPGAVGRQQWGYFLTAIAGPLAFAGLILAASFVLAVYAARLDMDIVLAGDDNTEDTDSTL